MTEAGRHVWQVLARPKIHAYYEQVLADFSINDTAHMLHYLLKWSRTCSAWTPARQANNRDDLQARLRSKGVSYVFLGKELGGRPRENKFYCDGVADYEKMAQADDFNKGIDRVVDGAQKYRIALMCSERDPMDCHRCLLVGRALAQRGVHVKHILDMDRILS